MAYKTWKATSTLLVYISEDTDRNAILTDRSRMLEPRWRIEKFKGKEHTETILTDSAPWAFQIARDFVEKGF